MSIILKNIISEIFEETRVKPRIGLTGSFGRGNYGDELYLKNYQYWFGGFADLYLLTGLPRKSYLQDFSNAYVDLMDVIVLGGGDLLVPHRYPIDLDFVDPAYLRKPLHVACIGVQRTSQDMDLRVLKRWQSFLRNDNIKTISTRDTGSEKWIKENIQPNITVSTYPDMVCALPLPLASKPEGAPILGIVTRHVADPKNYVLLEEIGRKLINEGWRVHHIIGSVSGHGKKDLENAKFVDSLGKEVIYSEDLDDISKALGSCSLILSFKLHTTLVGVMYGVPTICVNPVVKAKTFMKSAGLEHLVFSATDPKLMELIKKGTPAAPAVEKVEKLRHDASEFMKALGLQVWKDFCSTSTRKLALSETPSFPE